MTADREYRVPTFDDIHYYERRAREIRSEECARLLRLTGHWLRDLLHIGSHHGGAHAAH